jgi:hypothetical protein
MMYCTYRSEASKDGAKYECSSTLRHRCAADDVKVPIESCCNRITTTPWRPTGAHHYYIYYLFALMIVCGSVQCDHVPIAVST